MARCLYRVSWPQASLSAYPHGLFNTSVPLALSLSLPDASAVAEKLTNYAEGIHEPLLSKLEEMPLGATVSEQDYWQEELERVRKYAAKIRKNAEVKLVSPSAA